MTARRSSDGWDVSLTPWRSNKQSHPGLAMRFPVAIARSLMDAGYTRCVISITEEGILLRPYAATRNDRTSRVLLPEWSA